jgi:hypothetical protein
MLATFFSFFGWIILLSLLWFIWAALDSIARQLFVLRRIAETNYLKSGGAPSDLNKP